MTLEQREQVRTTVKLLTEAGIYRQGDSTYGSNWLTIPKPKGGYREVVDLRKVNKFMLPSAYPVRTPEEILLQMKETFCYFTELDLKIAFWQLKIDGVDMEICAVVTEDGIYLPQRLVQGAKDSSCILERTMREYLINPVKMLIKMERISEKDYALDIFRDNLFLATGTEELHKRILEKVLDRSRELNLKFGSGRVGVSEIQVLGFAVSSSGMRPLEKNLEQI